jgi:hypothetical protein
VTNIGCGVFYKCKSLTAIDYAGTKEQWHKIKKDAYWNSGSKIQVIRCIDGEVEPIGDDKDLKPMVSAMSSIKNCAPLSALDEEDFDWSQLINLA